MAAARARWRSWPPAAGFAALGWGPVDQLLSSASNFALSVLAGRLLGPAGLGVVFVGFSSYLIALGFLRALVLQPMVVRSADFDSDARQESTGHALTIGAAGALVCSATVLVTGLLISGEVGRGLRLFAPWIAPLIVQDLCRSALFRDGKGAKVTANDGAWLLTLAVTLPILLWLRSDWAVVSWWGFGGLVGAVLGLTQLRLRPGRPGESWTWWRSGASLSGWLFLESALVYGGAQGAIFILAPILGASDMGGLRAAETLFVPMSFLKPALEFPGLAVVSRTTQRPAKERLTMASGISGIAISVTLAYLLVMGLAGGPIMVQLFGPAFAPFDTLIVPFGAGQACAAAALGFAILLKAQRRGRPLAVAGGIGAAVGLVLSPLLGSLSGVRGAAWGLAAASGTAAMTTVLLAVGQEAGRRDADRTTP